MVHILFVISFLWSNINSHAQTESKLLTDLFLNWIDWSAERIPLPRRIRFRSSPDIDPDDIQNLMGTCLSKDTSTPCDKIFTKMQSVVFIANRQTDTQTDKHRIKHNLIGRGNEMNTHTTEQQTADFERTSYLLILCK